MFNWCGDPATYLVALGGISCVISLCDGVSCSTKVKNVSKNCVAKRGIVSDPGLNARTVARVVQNRR